MKVASLPHGDGSMIEYPSLVCAFKDVFLPPTLSSFLIAPTLSLCSLGSLGTRSLDQTGFKNSEIFLPLPKSLGLKACSTSVPLSIFFSNYHLLLKILVTFNLAIKFGSSILIVPYTCIFSITETLSLDIKW